MHLSGGVRLRIVFVLLLLMASVSCVYAQQTTAPTTLRFSIATIKPNPSGDGWSAQFTPQGFSAHWVTLTQLVGIAYVDYEFQHVSGVPKQLENLHFDIEAKVDDGDRAAYDKLMFKQRCPMLQALLAERFHLAVHRGSQDEPAFELTIAKGGPKLTPTKPENIVHFDTPGVSGVIGSKGRGSLTVDSGSMATIASALRTGAGARVFDETGLTGTYDMVLHWTPEARPGEAPSDSPYPDFFTAVQEQLGLKLVPTKRPVETIVVDHIEEPTVN